LNVRIERSHSSAKAGFDVAVTMCEPRLALAQLDAGVHNGMRNFASRAQTSTCQPKWQISDMSKRRESNEQITVSWRLK
jgi:hypothetical protein